MDKIPSIFSVEVCGALSELTDTISSARLRIFYKGLNRNGSYISEDFAEKLIQTIPYCPVKGIYESEEGDFSDHGRERTEGRIYGVVPADPNFAWEKHEDEDGVERDYACVDVYLYTALYDEAKDISGKSQSMELYRPSLKGDWQVIDGNRIYKYESASFLGLQVLGDDVTPCFEGSAFFSKESPESIMVLSSLFSKITELENELRAQNKGGEEMEDKDLIFKLSDKQKENKIFQALNKESYRYFVLEVFADTAVVFDMENDALGQVKYAKNEETEEVSIEGEVEEVYSEYVTKDEKTALGAIRKLGVTFTESLEKINTADSKIEELEGTVSTLTTEKENFAKVEQERDSLLEFKLGVELKEKEGILAKYEKALDSDVIEDYKTKLNDFTAIELEKELAFTLVRTSDSIEGIFSHNSNKQKALFQNDDEGDESSVVSILKRNSEKRKK